MRRRSPLPYRQRWWAATTLAAAVLLMAGCASRTGPVALAWSQLPEVWGCKLGTHWLRQVAPGYLAYSGPS